MLGLSLAQALAFAERERAYVCVCMVFVRRVALTSRGMATWKACQRVRKRALTKNRIQHIGSLKPSRQPAQLNKRRLYAQGFFLDACFWVK